MQYEANSRLTIDPWQKVVECERIIEMTRDATALEMLHQVRLLWIGLTDEQSRLNMHALAIEFDVIDRVHQRLMKFAYRSCEAQR